MNYSIVSRLVTCIAILIFCSSLANTSYARNFKRNAVSGKNSYLIYHHNLTKSCQTVRIKIDFIKFPKHGTASAKVSRRKYSAKNSSLEHCYGRSGLFLDIYYKSKKGFKGKDLIVYRRVSENANDKYNKQIHRLTINVR